MLLHAYCLHGAMCVGAPSIVNSSTHHVHAVLKLIAKSSNLRPPIVATAVTYFKRFFLKSVSREFFFASIFYHPHLSNPWTSVSPPLVAVTALYLASKVDEGGPVGVRLIARVASEGAKL